eukprot:CAMPEP_0202891896 /NCGR_PEP_ID=MMETSP1392-20130828/1821_1 /ASSEMBLY_ACC=CAM_ASM_000868 /TAXON_ID=225041 /ORGANISM="Chlamydomonas chlamydogama, Strain SAG 11-48b" /LENGTH=200 /DNA_ID=CAMNT_0049575763 /DNA_START=235 /DNA_END=837 /DNA_ORIENTATION=+
MEWEALRTLDAGSWFADKYSACRIPTLLDMLQRYRGKIHLHLELKSKQADLPQVVHAALEASGWLSDLGEQRTSNDAHGQEGAGVRQPCGTVPGLTLTSFHLTQLISSTKLLPGVPHGWLVQEMSDDVLREAQEAGLSQLCPRVDACSPEAVAHALAQGFSVRGWGVKKPELLLRAVSCGMQGATVDWPDKALDALKQSP